MAQVMPWEEYSSTPSNAGGGQGVVIPNAPKQPDMPSPTREPERWRVMTPDEIKAAGLQEGQRYQINGAGKIEPITTKELTEAESKAVGFYQRMRSANTQLERLGLDPQGFAGLLAQRISPDFSRGALTDDRRAQLDAIENFIAASLRLESGAAISPSEFEKQARIFFPQPGAGPRETDIKRQQRELAILGFKSVAGEQGAMRADQNLRDLGFVDENGLPIIQPITGNESDIVGAKVAYVKDGGAYDKDGNYLGLVGEVSDTSPISPIEQGLGSMVEGGINSTIGLVTNPVGQLMYNMIPGNQGEYNTGQIVREALGLPANTDPMGNAIIQGATGAMTGAGLASMASRVLPGMAGRVASTIASQPIQQVAGGAGAGAGAEFVREQGGGTGAQIAGGLLGGMAGAGGAGVAQALSAPRVAVPAAVTAAERASIPVMASDVAPPQTFMGKNLQQVGERIPLAGTGGLRATQQDARVAAVKDVLTGYGAGAEGLPDKVWRSVSTKRSDELTKYAKMKTEAIGSVNSAGEVPVAATTAAIDNEIANLSRISSEGFAPAISILRRWKNDIQGKSLEDIEILRKQIGEEFKAPELSAVSGVAQKSLNRIYNPLREDMGAFIRANGGSREANKWMIANRRLSELAGDLDKQALKSVLRNGDATPEAVNNLLFSQKRSDVAALYRALTPEGRANARAAVMDKVFRDIGGDMEAISPEKFITAVKKQGNSIGVLFSPEEAQRIGGLVKALNLTRRAGEAGVVTNTGQQGVALAGFSGLTGLVGGLLGGAATAGTTVAGTVATAGAIGGLARVMESRAARNILLQLSKAKPQEEAPLVKRFIAAINASKE